MVAKKPIKFLAVLAIILSSLNVFTHSENKIPSDNDDGRVNTQEEIRNYIGHHLAESHDFTLYSYTNDAGERKHFGFSLPVIIWTSKGLKAFMSSAFHHNDDGRVIVEKGGVKLAKIHSKIYELNEGTAQVTFDETHHPANVHRVLDFSITKSVLGILLIGLLMLLGFSSLAKQYKNKKVPTGFGRVLEPLILYVRDEIVRPNIGDKHYRRFTGYLLTVFFFIWILNLVGLMPFGFNVTGQLAVTAALAILTLIIYTFSANKDYWKHVLWMPGIPVLLKPILAIIELAGHFLIKPFSLLIRLFANITAGHVVIMSLIAVIFTMKEDLGIAGATSISLLLSILIILIEVLVAFLQAYIFTMLSALFIGMVVEEHEHH